MTSVQNCVEVESGRVFAYASASRESLLQAVIGEGILKRADKKRNNEVCAAREKSIISSETDAWAVCKDTS